MPSDPESEPQPHNQSEPLDSEELPDPEEAMCLCGQCKFLEFTSTER